MLPTQPTTAALPGWPVNPPAAAPLSQDALKAAIAHDLNTNITIPDGHRGAVVVFANKDTIETAIAGKVLEKGSLVWTVGAVYSHDWTGAHADTMGTVSTITW